MLQAIRNTVIVKPIYEDQRSQILLPEYSPVYKKYHGFVYGIVISIGSRYPYKDYIKPGDKVLFRRHEGKPIYENGELYLVLTERKHADTGPEATIG